MARVKHCDLSPLQPVIRLPDGRIRVQAHLTRVGIFDYRQPDGSVRKELRLPEEVFRPESMQSFAQVPFTDDHPADMLTASNACRYAKGATGDTIVRDDDHIRGTIGVFDAATIQKMESGKLELSCGYTCDLEEVPGVHPKWGAYHAIQRNMIGNHVALVKAGRAGRTAAARMDGAHVMIVDYDPDQSRDPDGKFGSGGGSSEGASLAHLPPPVVGTHFNLPPPPGYSAHTPTQAPAPRATRTPGPIAVTTHKGIVTNAPTSAKGQPLSVNEKLALKTLASLPEGASDAQIVKKLGTTKAHTLELLQSARAKLGLSPVHDLHTAATSLKKSGGLIIKKTDSLGTGLASSDAHGTLRASPMSQLPNARIDVVVHHDEHIAPGSVDPDDLASRNAETEDAAATSQDMPWDKASYADMYDADGNLTETAGRKIAAASFAVPGRSRLPIHDPSAVSMSMDAFSTEQFDDADEKHAAFNRIKGKAVQFGINSKAFHRANAGTLDRKDEQMITSAEKAAKLADKKAKRKAKLDAAVSRADTAEQALATAQGKIASLTTDLETVKGATDKVRTDATERFDAAVASKVELVGKASEVLGHGKVNVKATDMDIMKAVIKHVDGKDVTDTRPGYVEALFEGACERARKDASAITAGANALGAARAAAVTAPVVAQRIDLAPVVAHADFEDEQTALQRMKSRSAQLASQPGRMTKDAVMAAMNGNK